MSAAHFVEGKIAVAVRQAERNGDTVLIARQVKEATQQASQATSSETPVSPPSANPVMSES